MSETIPPSENNNIDPDATQVTSPEMKRTDWTPVDLPPPAVHGSGIRTSEEFDPGAARSAAGKSVNQPASPPVDALLGTTYLEKYEVISILGSGGMGVVYKGRHIFFDDIVAIKMLHSNLASASQEAKAKVRKRFHQEAKAMRKLRHPGIVSITDFGVDDHDRPYMVMEHIEGRTFSDVLSEHHTLSVKEALPVFLEICDALSELHQKGIVHRDLKPSNIMLVVDEHNKVHIKLLDFGIAKMLDMEGQQSLTRTGEMLGTPLYMSPEQIQNSREDGITFSSDLYSLGCMMYMCLTGTPPFVGENKLRTMEKHCTATPASLKESSKGIDFAPGVEAIVMRLLEKAPEDRYGSVDELKDALIDMGVKNRFMPRPADRNVPPGQLYMTGAIPEMPKSISDMVPRSSGDIQDATSKLSIGRSVNSAIGNDWHNRKILVSVIFLNALLLGVFLYSILSPKAPQAKQMARTTARAEPRAPASVTAFTADDIVHRAFVSDADLSSLSLKGERGLSDKGLNELGKFRSLTALILSDTDLDTNATQHISNNSLLLLNLSNNSRISNWSLRHLKRLKNLERLSVAQTSVTDDGLRYLADAPALDFLCLADNPLITDRGLNSLVPEKSRLKGLYLKGCNISDASAVELLKFKNLIALDVSDNHRISDNLIHILKIKKTRLKLLSLAQDNITAQGIHDLLEFNNLEWLDLSQVKLSERSQNDLMAMKHLANLNVGGCGLTDADIGKLHRALPNVQVRTKALLANFETI